MNMERFKDRQGKDEDLAEEIDSHLAHEQDASAARGLSPEEAHRQARLKFGNPRVARERVWRYRSLPWIDDGSRDLRFALRSLAKTPGFTIIAIAVIAVGIGVNTAVFSVINTVLLKPLTYPDPQSLVMLINTSPRGSGPGANVPKFNIWHQQRQIFQQVAGYDRGGAGLNLTGGDKPEQVQGIHVTADYFAMFGAPVVAGRTFTAAEDSPNGGHVVVLSYGLWKSRFGGNPGIVGRTIQIDGQPYLVVGVIGKSFVTEPAGDLWLPFQFDLTSQDMAHYFMVAARFKPGVTLQQADAQLKLAADQFRRTYEGALGPQEGFGVEALQDTIIGDSRTSLLVLLGAVGFVLLIACANVANLMLVRASARKRELATTRRAWRRPWAHHPPTPHGELCAFVHWRGARTHSRICWRSPVAQREPRRTSSHWRGRLGGDARLACAALHAGSLSADWSSLRTPAGDQRLPSEYLRNTQRRQHPRRSRSP